MKVRSCTLRVPEVYNDFLEKAVTSARQSKSNFFLVGSAVLACLDNEKSWRDTLEDVKKRRAFEEDMDTIGKFSHLLSDLNLLEASGITQEMLDTVFLFYGKVADYLKSKKLEQDLKQK
jgi:hypothetical protein